MGHRDSLPPLAISKPKKIAMNAEPLFLLSNRLDRKTQIRQDPIHDLYQFREYSHLREEWDNWLFVVHSFGEEPFFETALLLRKVDADGKCHHRRVRMSGDNLAIDRKFYGPRNWNH